MLKFSHFKRTLSLKGGSGWVSPLSPFALKGSERWVALTALVAFTLLNVLVLMSYPDNFTRGGHLGFYSIFYKHFHISGFDAWSYITLSNMRVHFTVSRHPLFLAVLYPLYLINQCLMDSTGTNWAIFLMAMLLVVCAVYSAVFFYRICHKVMGLPVIDSSMLTMLFFSFAHVMLATAVPDHFVISLMLLLLTASVVGKHMKEGTDVPILTTATLFFLTAGITLTNGVKTLLAALFCNGKRVFRWKSILFCGIIPVTLLGGIYWLQYKRILEPQDITTHLIEQQRLAKDSTFAKEAARHDRWEKEHNGKAAADDVPLLQWSDISTDRTRSVVENLMGESIQLHEEHLLKDVQQNRPVFVAYSHWWNYAVEAILTILIVIGLWCGRRSRFLWMLVSWVAFDLLMHIGFGFAINEVYIMAAHWAFIIPLAIGYTLFSVNRERRYVLRTVVVLLALFLLSYNVTLLITYLA